MGVNLGFVIGPVFGGLLYNNYLWLIFIGDAITTLASLLLIMIFVKDPQRVREEILTSEALNYPSTFDLYYILELQILFLYLQYVLGHLFQ